MSLKRLRKQKANRVIGIDASTKSLAWAVFENGEPVNCGQVFFRGSTVFERLKDAKDKTRAMVKSGVLVGDYVVMEAAVKVNSADTAFNLAYVYGAILGELMVESPKVEKIYPITWQTAIGVPNLSKEDKDKIKKDNPDRKPSWYKAEGRKIRKSRILDIAREYFQIPSDSDDIGDAVGLALYVTRTLTK